MILQELRFRDRHDLCRKQTQEGSVHRDLLLTKSKYFADLLAKIEMGNNELYLKGEDPGAIEIMLEYLYHGSIAAISEKDMEMATVASEHPTPRNIADHTATVDTNLIASTSSSSAEAVIPQSPGEHNTSSSMSPMVGT